MTPLAVHWFPPDSDDWFESGAAYFGVPKMTSPSYFLQGLELVRELLRTRPEPEKRIIFAPTKVALAVAERLKVDLKDQSGKARVAIELWEDYSKIHVLGFMVGKKEKPSFGRGNNAGKKKRSRNSDRLSSAWLTRRRQPDDAPHPYISVEAVV